MPLFYYRSLDKHTALAVWKITEPETFFLEQVKTHREVRHPHKRLQHLAGRYLLQLIQPDFPLESLCVNESKKPILPSGTYHFSISHCGDFAAVIVSDNRSVGVDVELVTEKIERVRHKFLSLEEYTRVEGIATERNITDLQLLTLLWSAKEAMFKWYGKGKVDFKENMQIQALSFDQITGAIQAQFTKEKTENLQLRFELFGDLCLAWI